MDIGAFKISNCWSDHRCHDLPSNVKIQVKIYLFSIGVEDWKI